MQRRSAAPQLHSTGRCASCEGLSFVSFTLAVRGAYGEADSSVLCCASSVRAVLVKAATEAAQAAVRLTKSPRTQRKLAAHTA